MSVPTEKADPGRSGALQARPTPKAAGVYVSAPKSGDGFLTYWDKNPVFAAWFEDQQAYRVLSWSPRLGWGINGGCAPFEPGEWWPIPVPTSALSDGGNAVTASPADDATRSDSGAEG